MTKSAAENAPEAGRERNEERADMNEGNVDILGAICMVGLALIYAWSSSEKRKDGMSRFDAYVLNLIPYIPLVVCSVLLDFNVVNYKLVLLFMVVICICYAIGWFVFPKIRSDDNHHI